MEKLKAFIKDNKKYIIFTAVAWALFAVLIYLAPYTGDDWPWGSKTGKWRYDTWFEDYNGRFAGNLLVLALTRSEALQVFVISLSVLAIIFLPLLFAKKKSLSLLCVSSMLFLMMPHPIFVQSIMWTSGFTNYVPPIVFTLIYLILVKDVFKNKAPHYSLLQHILLSVITATIGYIGALFMENVTIYNVIVGVGIIAYTLIKHKKLYPFHISYLVFTLWGLKIMFSNSAYKNVAEGSDFYRGFAFGDYEKIFRHLNYICDNLFSKNTLVLLVITALCLALIFKVIKETESQKSKRILYSLFIVNVSSLALIFAKGFFPSWQIIYGSAGASAIIYMGVVILYCASVLLTVLLLVTDKMLRRKLTALLLGVPLLVGPFLFITPLNARCLVPAFILMIVFTAMLFDYVRVSFNFSRNTIKTITVSATVVALGFFIFFISIYSVVHKYETLRVEYIKKQVQSGITQDVIFTEMPYRSYVWLDIPESENWQKRFNSFYGISEKVRYKYVTVEEFDRWRIEFDKNEVNK